MHKVLNRAVISAVLGVPMRKTVPKKLWSKQNLPEELWPEILSRLPVKSLLRFRSVCKSFKLFIDDPNFLRLHFNRFNKCREPNLFFVQSGRSSFECVVKNHTTLRTNLSLGYLESSFDSLNVLKTIPALCRTQVREWSIVSSIHGLFMLQFRNSSNLMLWNPSIRKTLTLPLPPFREIPKSQIVEFGLGFDPLINDYKFVRFVMKPTNGVQFVAIYTLGTNSWKTVEFQGERQGFSYDYEVGKRSISLNGVIYDLARNQCSNPLDLVSFDLKSEVFVSFELPVTDGHMYHQALTLVDDGCSIALVRLSSSNGSIHVLERLGDDVKSWRWIHHCIFPIPYISILRFLMLKKNGEMLLVCGYSVMCYNLETCQYNWMLKKNKKSFQIRNTMEYRESLILHHL